MKLHVHEVNVDVCDHSNCLFGPSPRVEVKRAQRSSGLSARHPEPNGQTFNNVNNILQKSNLDFGHITYSMDL